LVPSEDFGRKLHQLGTSLSIPSWKQVESFLRSLSKLKELAGSAA